jgi:UDP-N-acetylmuramoyl-tripeptide--D-alanyl-D-alanine ligase
MIRCEADIAHANVEFAGVSTDSRTVQPGNLFIPLIGETFDGHEYAAHAVERGAAAVLWQAEREGAPAGVPVIRVQDTLAALQELAAAYRRQLPVRIIGVTGSNGKTTTKDMIAACLATTYKMHKTQGNLNNHIGLPLTLLAMDEDTQMAVLEMGMSGVGEIELLAKIAAPEVAVITNVGEAHLMQLGSRERIARAKLEITAGLPEDGLLIYNGDEPLLERTLDQMNLPKTMLRFRFGEQATNDYYPIAIMLQQQQTSFKLNVPFSPVFTIPLPGMHNVLNALAAVAASKYMGVSEADIVRGLAEMRITGMRSEFLQAANGATVINDAYNASPSSMRAALKMFESLSSRGRKLVVLGDMLELGDRSEEFHREIGRLLDPDKIDYVLTYGKLASCIAEEAAKRYPEGYVFSFTDKEELASELARLLTERDMVLFKASRGMQLEHIIRMII